MNETPSPSPTEPEVQPIVLETLSDSTPGPDQESFTGSAHSPEVEMNTILCPNDVSDQLQPIPADSDGPDADPEVEPTDLCTDPAQGYLRHQWEAGHSFLFRAEGPDRASSQNDTPRSADYKCYQLTRHRLDHLYGCSR